MNNLETFYTHINSTFVFLLNIRIKHIILAILFKGTDGDKFEFY